MAFCAAGNNIGAEGAKALAAALEPRQNPDGTWAFNGALNELVLTGESFPPTRCQEIHSIPGPVFLSQLLMSVREPDDAGINLTSEGRTALFSSVEALNAQRPRKKLKLMILPH